MTDVTRDAPAPAESRDPDRRGPGGGPGEEYAGVYSIAFAGVYIVAMLGFLLYCLVMLWPQPTPAMSHTERERIVAARQSGQQKAQPPEEDTASGGAAGDVAGHAAGDTTSDTRHPRMIIPGPGVVGVPGFYSCAPPDAAMLWVVHEDDVLDPQCVQFFGGHFPISNEQRLLLIVLTSGALGSLLHALRSLRWYVGTRYLKKSWIPQYYFFPFLGALLALGIYGVLRGGFFSPTADVTETSPISFAAAAFLVGVFNEEAVAKLRDIAESFFAPKPRGTEKAPEFTPRHSTPGQQGDGARGAGKAPTITGIELKRAAAGDPADAIEIQGTGFTETTEVEVNGAMRRPKFEGPTRLTLLLEAAEAGVLAGTLKLTLAAVNPGPDGGHSETVTVP